MEIREMVENAIKEFNEQAAKDERLASELRGMERTVVIRLEDAAYHFTIKDGRATELEDGDANGDIEIITDSGTLRALFNREMGPMKALATKKLRINASLQDKLRIRKFF